jgi:GNAT superfamily N-acetyltransferase
MPSVVVAASVDLLAWRRLAREVEPLFGPMVGRAAFEEALARKVERGQALCVREADGDAGAPLLGGLLWSSHPPRYRIGWLAVTARARRQGVGRQLVAAALAWVVPPATVDVVTFGDDNPESQPARRFYLALGFESAEAAPHGPEGGSRQVFRLCL